MRAATGRPAVQNFLDPAILFFVFGVLAGLVRSNLPFASGRRMT